ncbi:MAG: hypothetical protein WC949_04705 [Candidatus Paceibacterota bacterium]|jgi:hypothetical protein
MSIRETLNRKIPSFVLLIVGGAFIIFTAVELYYFNQIQKEISETVNQTYNLIGGDTDAHGCLIGAGYSWCQAKQKCLRPWEEKCEEGIAVDFNKIGNLANNSPDKNKDGWVLVYEEPGKPAIEAVLVFDENNPCVFIPGEDPCSPDRLEIGQRVRVEGTQEENSNTVAVKWIELNYSK